MIALRRRIIALTIRLATFAASVRWILLSLVLAGVGVAGVIVAIPLGINLALGAASVVLAVLDVQGYRQRQRLTQFTPRSTDSFADVRATLASNGRFEFIDFSGGTFQHDQTGSEVLADPSVIARLHVSDYVAPIRIRELGRLFQRRHVRGNAYAYNDPVIGIGTNLGYGLDDHPTVIDMVASRYWDYLASDVFASHEVMVEGQQRVDLGRRLVISRNGRPRDFGDSWLLNALGISVLMITTDGLYVAVTQSRNNDSAKGEFAPSGSGSLEPKDFRGATQMRIGDLCTNGALREATEESAIRESEVATVHMLGNGRWLQKSAKPEVLMLAFLTIDSHAARGREVPRNDRPYTLAIEPERFVAPPSSWNRHELSTMVDGRICAAMSVPLGACLVLLADKVSAGTGEIASELAARLTRS